MPVWIGIAILAVIVTLTFFSLYYYSKYVNEKQKVEAWQNMYNQKPQYEVIADENALEGYDDDWRGVKVRRVKSGYINNVRIIE